MECGKKGVFSGTDGALLKRPAKRDVMAGDFIPWAMDPYRWEMVLLKMLG